MTIFAFVSNKVLIISNSNELVRIKPERVVYVESDGNYSTMVLHDKTEQVFTMLHSLCQMERMQTIYLSRDCIQPPILYINVVSGWALLISYTIHHISYQKLATLSLFNS